MLLIFHWTEQRKPVGWTALRCPRCDRIEAFCCLDRLIVTHAFFIPVGARSTGRVLVCDFCASHFAPEAGADLRLVPGWKRSDGLTALTSRVDPKLDPAVPSAKEPPDLVALEALLRTLDERSRSADQEIGRGLLTGGVTGTILGGILGWLVSLVGLSLAPGPAPEQFIPFGMFGAFAGVVVGGIAEARRKRREAIDDVLGGAIRKHRIRPSALRPVAEQMQPPVPRAVRVLATYAQ